MYSFKRNNFPYSPSIVIPSISNTEENPLQSDEIISPKTAKYGENCPIHIPPNEGCINQIATFSQKIVDTNVDTKIYLTRGAFFFKTKMSVDTSENVAICKTGKKCCPASKQHFYVMPGNTPWTELGALGIVINLDNPEQPAAYSICANIGRNANQDSSGTRFSGDIGEGSVTLGKYLKIKYSDIGDGSKGYQSGDILYAVFPGTSRLIYENNKIYTLKEINKLANATFECWGGWKYMKYIIKKIYDKELI